MIKVSVYKVPMVRWMLQGLRETTTPRNAEAEFGRPFPKNCVNDGFSFPG